MIDGQVLALVEYRLCMDALDEDQTQLSSLMISRNARWIHSQRSCNLLFGVVILLQWELTFSVLEWKDTSECFMPCKA